MEQPSNRQIAEAIVQSARLGESDAEFDARMDALRRLDDAELAEAMVGVSPEVRARVAAGLGAQAPGVEPAPAADPPAQVPSVLAFDAVPTRRRAGGWTADKQRAFIAALAETGCVSEACAEVGIAPRSAYRLREHPGAAPFRDAWDHALSLATTRLASLAFERAVHGTSERYYKDGELVGERRKPNDRLLMWLLAHHDPSTYGWLSKAPREPVDRSWWLVRSARDALPKLTARLADVDAADCPAEPLSIGDYDMSEDGTAA